MPTVPSVNVLNVQKMRTLDAKMEMELSESKLVELLRQLQYRFSAGADQLARVTGLSYEQAARSLDRA